MAIRPSKDLLHAVLAVSAAEKEVSSLTWALGFVVVQRDPIYFAKHFACRLRLALQTPTKWSPRIVWDSCVCKFTALREMPSLRISSLPVLTHWFACPYRRQLVDEERRMLTVLAPAPFPLPTTTLLLTSLVFMDVTE